MESGDFFVTFKANVDFGVLGGLFVVECFQVSERVSDSRNGGGLLQESGFKSNEVSDGVVIVALSNVSRVGQVLLSVESVVVLLHDFPVGEGFARVDSGHRVDDGVSESSGVVTKSVEVLLVPELVQGGEFTDESGNVRSKVRNRGSGLDGRNIVD